MPKATQNIHSKKPKLVRLDKNLQANLDAGLYVIKYKNCFSCLGFDVTTDRCNKYGQWLLDRGVDLRDSEGEFNRAKPGTLEHYQIYKSILDQVRVYCDKEKVQCEVDLQPQLVGLEGKRVEVIDCYGDKRRFKVGKSVGFIPLHLELARTDSSGGPAITGTPFQSVRVVRT